MTRVTAYVAGALLTVAAPADGQQEQAPADVVSETVEVRVVDVDVVVVDKRGRPVRGLKREEFELFEDGRPVEIEYFAGPGAEDEPAARRVDAQVAEPARISEVAPPSNRLTVVIYLDEQVLHPAHRQRVLADLDQALEQWKELGARFVVARHPGELEIVQAPTDDVERIRELLRSYRWNDTLGFRPEIERRSALQAIGQSYQFCLNVPLCVPCVDNWQQMLLFASDYARSEETRTALAVAGLADLASALAGLPGRKTVLYVGDGFQHQPGRSMFRYVGDLCEVHREQAPLEVEREAVVFDESSRYTQLAAHAAANRVVFTMLDAGGTRAAATSNIDGDVVALDASGTSSGSFNPQFARIAALFIDNIQTSHFVIANETGGKAILNADRPLRDLELLGDELQATYSLGFTPQHPPTGRVHLLEVKLVEPAAKGRTLRYRRSYRDKQLEARLADELVAALFLGESQGDDSNPLGIQAYAGDTTRIDRKRHELPVQILLPESAAAPPPESASPRQVRVWMTAVSDDGRRTGIRQQLLDLGPGGIEPEKGVYSLVVDIELPEGDFTIAVGVRDELTQEASFARLRAAIPTPAPAP
ncbi:MAG TPA: VWA domain-containing protein [Thermoanaerobaculia bacterium]|nr:VWA domain-containing protein [Thermoanaerobaculia bacterium]